MKSKSKICPCNPNKNYSQCCEPFHSNKNVPQTPEQLMRSRYSAFVLEKYDYLIKTHHVNFRGQLTIDDLKQEPHFKWLRLEVLKTSSNDITDTKGTVTFKAWYRFNNHIDAIFETSDFIKQDGKWYYTKGIQH